MIALIPCGQHGASPFQRHVRSAAQAFLGVLLLVALLAGAGVVAAGPATAAPALPAGFVVRDMPSGQDEALTDFDFAPDGSWFTAGKNGRVAWVSSEGETRTLAQLDVVTTQDLGLSGIAVASDYASSRFIYTARTLSVGGTWTMRLSAWAVGGSPVPSSLTGERVLWDLPAGSDVHSITGLVAAADGTLWVSIGDSADFRRVDPLALRALDTTTGYGKVLHVLPDGRGVADNPFYDAAAPASWQSRVYASGFRSPFRISLDPASGAPVLGDVGWNTWEEIDLIRPGASYGWPCWEGRTQTPGYEDLAACQGVGNADPLYTYRHGPMGTSVTGGIVYTGGSYPEEYRGAYFFGDYSSQRLYTLRYDAQGQLTRQPEVNGFGVGNGLPVKFGAAANGDIVYADIGGATLKRLVYVPGNRPPSAQAAITTDPGTRTVSFDGSGSSDLDGENLTYQWDFGDGTNGSGARVQHSYAAPGTAPLTARLTVTDPQAASGTTTFTVVPSNEVPVIALAAPPPGTQFAVGDPVQATATATDREDGALPVTWSVVLVHCSGGYCHEHPGETFSGGSFTRAFQDHGDDTRMEITATATDRFGVRSRQSFVAQPKLRVLTVTAGTPSAITVNGVARASAELTVGARVSVIAPTVASDGVATFGRWDDGAARTRELTMPDGDLTLSAAYFTPIDRRYDAEPALRTLLGPPTAPEAGDAALRYRTHAQGRLYWTPQAGVHEVHGSILGTYLAGGGHVRWGVPLTDETATPDGGRFNDFALGNASVYWSPGTGAHVVYGSIGALWRGMGADRSVHGYPRTDELATPNGRGRYNDFQNGGIYWLPGGGAHSVYGAIYQRWAGLGYENGFLGFPLTSETGTPDGVGRFNHFEGGSVYWTPATGAHEVHGAILARWRAMGWERSVLGYPTSEEFDVPGGRRSNFQHGYLVWNAVTGQVTDRAY